MSRSVVLLLVAVVAVVVGVSYRPTGAQDAVEQGVTPPVGQVCRVTLEEFHSERDRTAVIDGAVLVAIDDNWVIVESTNGGRTWIPRERVTKLYFPKRDSA